MYENKNDQNIKWSKNLTPHKLHMKSAFTHHCGFTLFSQVNISKAVYIYSKEYKIATENCKAVRAAH